MTVDLEEARNRYCGSSSQRLLEISRDLHSASEASLAQDSCHQACEALDLESLPCLMWREHALGHCGVPALFFDMFLLVNDIEDSAQALIKPGIERTAANLRCINLRVQKLRNSQSRPWEI